MFSTDDTIIAIATPAGRGGIGVVRVSGPLAHAIARRLTGRDGEFEPRRATFATLVIGEARGEGAEGRAIDHVVCTFFPAPRSYTGEDVVEVSAHGSPVVLTRILEEAMRAGARLARPGEFTFRAHLHGRLDLVQAEAVGDLIEAVTPVQARAAFAQLDGTLTEALREIRARVFDLVIRLEACLDFPEEDYHFITREELLRGVADVERDVLGLLDGARVGRVIREGAVVVILGRPNVGKSSLFNGLLGSGRAIVTPTPGTTRDLLTERSDVEGVPVTYVDTAGLRESGDEIEREGVSRARRAGSVADLQLHVFDRSETLTDEDHALLAAGGARRALTVLSKADLPARWTIDALQLPGGALRPVEVSAFTGRGMEELQRSIYLALVGADVQPEGARVTNVRHQRLLEEAHVALGAARDAVRQGASEEFVVDDLMVCVGLFDQVSHTGASDPDVILETIFARFCIGK